MQTKPITRYTRAGRNGKEIECPSCGHIKRVYHFSWYAVTCQGCKQMINKYDYKEVVIG